MNSNLDENHTQQLQQKNRTKAIRRKSGVLTFTLVLMLSGCYDPEDNCRNDTGAKISAYVAAQTLVKRRLRSPSSAEFPSYRRAEVRFVRECHFEVSGYFDAQNAFGGTVRTRFSVDIEADPVEGGHTGRNFKFR